MKKFLLASRFFIFALVWASLPPARAGFALNVSTSPTTVPVGGTIIYSITVSNTANLILGAQVTSTFPADTAIISAINNFSPGQVFTNSGLVQFTFDQFPVGAIATFTIQLRPSGGTSFTNLITALNATGSEVAVSTNVISTFDVPKADLGISASGLPPTVVVGDVFNYSLTVTNAGPSSAPGVIILSELPPNLNFVSVTPTVPFSTSPTELLLSPGTLTNAQTMTYVVTLQAQTAGTLILTNTIKTLTVNTNTQTIDPDGTDNAFTNSLHIIGLVTNTVAIVSASPMVFNYQTALLEQVVVVSNQTSSVIDSVRIMATNLVAPNRLFNATGTNGGNPYVVLGQRLGVGGTAAVNLQFFVTDRTVIDPGLLAVEGPSFVTLTLPSGTVVSPTVSHVRNGGYSSVLVSFPTVVGRKYSLVAGDSIVSPLVTNFVTVTNIVTGTNGVLATNLVTTTNLVPGPIGIITNRIALFPPFTATTTRGQFIDSGPQTTGDGDRFYNVIEQP